MEDEERKVAVRLEGLAVGGAAVGTVVDGPVEARSKKAFVRFGVPGELVTAIIQSEAPRYIEGLLVDVCEPSNARVRPRCPYFGVCGGCDLQQIGIHQQRLMKVQMVEGMLARQGKLQARTGVKLIGENLPAYNYRRRVTLQCGDGRLGFYRRGTGDVIAIEHCPISRPELERALSTVRASLTPLSPAVQQIVLESDGSDVSVLLRLCDDRQVIDTFCSSAAFNGVCGSFKTVCVEARGKEVWRQSKTNTAVGRFSQVNIEANDLLVSHVCSLISADTVTDLYCGSGNFSLPLAKKGVVIDAVEVDQSLIDEGKRVAQELGVGALVAFHRSSCEQYVRERALRSSVILDPPRSGAKDVVRRITPTVTKEVVYVSCSLPTLVRDLKLLTSSGFALESVAVLDMFPQTGHVEHVAQLLASQ